MHFHVEMNNMGYKQDWGPLAPASLGEICAELQRSIQAHTVSHELTMVIKSCVAPCITLIELAK